MRIALPSELPGRPGILGASSARFGSASLGSEGRVIPEMSPQLSNVARENLSQRAYLRIRASLIHSELRPGQRLVLRPLAAELQLSPTPVREALLRLVSEQALALDERGSAIVPIIGLNEFNEITDIRCDLEGRAAMRAALHASADEIEHVASIAATHHEAMHGGDSARMTVTAVEIHRLVCRMARAPLMLRILEGIWMRIGPVYALRPSGQDGLAAEEADHLDRLLEALRGRDGESARAALVADVRRSSDWLARCIAQPTVLAAA